MSTPDGELRGSAGPDRRRAASSVAAGVLATLAASAVVLAEDARWLRLAVVAALWASLLAALVLARQARAEAAAAAEVDDLVDDLAAADEEIASAEDRIAVLQRDHERRVAREVAAREEAEQAALKAREEAASLREELARERSHADAVTLQSVGVPAVPARGAPWPRGVARLRVVGDPGPSPHGATPAASAAPAAAPAPTVPPPAPLRPAGRGAPTPRNGNGNGNGGNGNGRGSDHGAAARTPEGPASTGSARPVRPAAPPGSDAPTSHVDASVLAAGSFVDQYVRSAGYDGGEQAGDQPGTEPGERPDERRTRRGPPGGAANRWPGESTTSGGRTVAELLAAHAAHAAAGGTGGRRRREP